MDREDAWEWFCVIICHLFLISSFIALLLWLTTFVHHFPRCSVQYFYIPALNKSLNSPDNTTLNFMIGLKNIDDSQGIYYDDVYLSFSSSVNKSSPVLVANYTVPRFHQGHEKKAKKWGQAQLFDNQMVFRAVLPNGLAAFRVDLKTQLKYKFMFWKTRRYRFDASVDLEVNEDGATKVKNKVDGIKLKKSDKPLSIFVF